MFKVILLLSSLTSYQDDLLDVYFVGKQYNIEPNTKAIFSMRNTRTVTWILTNKTESLTWPSAISNANVPLDNCLLSELKFMIQ